MRNPEAFISYMPGVNNGSGDSSINGGPRRAKEILIDGAEATIPESGGVIFQFRSIPRRMIPFSVTTGGMDRQTGK